MLILEAKTEKTRLTRQNIYRYFKKYLRKGKDNQPDVYLIECKGKKYVVKDYFHKPIPFKMVMGTITIRLEYEAYRRLQGIDGIPRLYGMIDPFALVIEYIEGKDLPYIDDDEIDYETLQKIGRLINEVHHNNLVHTDLGHTDMGRSVNIILDRTKEPYIIDFAGVMFKPPGFSILGRWLYEVFYRHDLRLIANLKNKYMPEMIDVDDLKILEPKLPLEEEFLKAVKKI